MEAKLYQALNNGRVHCRLCAHRCRIENGQRGLCQVRVNRDGVLETRVYGLLIARHVDPIEKKPIYHLRPGSRSYSIATVGCNFRCAFCQNADIAQMPADRNGTVIGQKATPEAVVDAARRAGCESIAYTYTEPTVFFEFALDTAKLAKAQGLYNVFVTNGYMTEDALNMVAPYLDVANVDLKAFSDDFYKKYCGARLGPVRETLIRMKHLGIFIEVTTLLIPGLNDAPDEIRDMATFIATELGPETPWHISRFHPTYQMEDRPPTPVETLVGARKIGMAQGLRHVYLGNVPGHGGESTHCPRCRKKVIDRMGYLVHRVQLESGRCSHCGGPIAGVGL